MMMIRTHLEANGGPAERFAGTFQEEKFGFVVWMSGWSQVVMRPDQILAMVSVRMQCA